MSIWGTPPLLSPRDQVIEACNQQAVKYDPVYLPVKLGTVYLLYLKLSKQQAEETDRLKKQGKLSAPLEWIKVSFNDDSSMQINEPGFFTQTLPRTWTREDRNKLTLIRPHLIKFLRWFNYEESRYQTIIKVCKQGLEVLLRGYQHQQSAEMTLTPLSKDSEKNEKPLMTLMITMQAPISEIDPVIPILQNDIDLLDEALAKKDERRKEEFKIKLAKEENKYFSLHQTPLVEMTRTIDDYISQEVKSRWDDKTISGIVEFFSAIDKNFNHYDAITSAISSKPAEHAKMNEKINNLIIATLVNYNIAVKT